MRESSVRFVVDESGIARPAALARRMVADALLVFDLRVLECARDPASTIALEQKQHVLRSQLRELEVVFGLSLSVSQWPARSSRKRRIQGKEAVGGSEHAESAHMTGRFALWIRVGRS